MLSIRVNDSVEKLNIGCRTFIALDELLGLLSANDLVVIHNSNEISSDKMPHTIVQSGDSLMFEGAVEQ